MRALKKNFIFILLAISSIATGVLALSTALRLAEFRSAAPSKTSALTPPCSLTFTIEDDTPRTTSELPTVTRVPSPTTAILVQQPSPTPTFIPTPSLKPTITTRPTLTPSPTTSLVAPNPNTISPTTLPLPSPTKSLIAQGITSTPTPTIIKTSPTTIEPNLPVSGTNLPTLGAFLLGVIFLTAGLYRSFRFKL